MHFKDDISLIVKGMSNNFNKTRTFYEIKYKWFFRQSSHINLQQISFLIFKVQGTLQLPDLKSVNRK